MQMSTPERCMLQPVLLHREAMTGVVVQNMATGGHAAIQCGGPVLRIAVYVRRLAVQLKEKILIYGLPADAATSDLSLHVIACIDRSLECNLMMIAAHHLILCQVEPAALKLHGTFAEGQSLFQFLLWQAAQVAG